MIVIPANHRDNYVSLIMEKLMSDFKKILPILILLSIFYTGCKKESPIDLKPNVPPKTFLWIQTDSTQTLNPTISRQIIRWWGEDPDGFIKGYLFAYFKVDSPFTAISFDTVGYSWVIKNDSLVAFPLFSAREKYQVVIKAVDNSFRGNIDVGATIRFIPKPYWDKNNNGILDGEDVDLSGITTAIDSKGAKQIFPIKNSPPIVEFAKASDPNNPTDPPKTIQQPETTYTVATFSWVGKDLDGDNTIKNYRINLNNPNDNSKWFEFSSTQTMVTIEAPRSRTDNATGEVIADVYIGIFPTMLKIGELPGLRLNDTNKIYLQAKDVAGELSPAVSLPEGSRKWFVKKPSSKLLTVINYGASDLSTVIGFYKSAFAAIDTFPGIGSPRNFGNFDMLDIRRGSTDKAAGVMVPQFLNPQFVRTLKLFDFVFWFTDFIPDNYFHIHAIAQFPLYLYNGSGGKVLYSTRFGNWLGDPRGSLVDFAPVDMIGSVLIDTRIPNDWPIYPDSVSFAQPFPTLRFNPTATQGGSHSLNVRAIIKRADAKYILSIPPVPGRVPPAAFWTGRVNIGVMDDAKSFVFLSLPLHLMNGYDKVWTDRPGVKGQGVPAFLKRVFIDEFGG